MYQGELASLVVKVEHIESQPKHWVREALEEVEKKVTHLYNLVIMDHSRGDVLVSMFENLKT